MIDFENYKPNLEISDQYDVVNVHVSKNTIYSGPNIATLKNKRNYESCDLKQPLGAAVVGLNNTAATLPAAPPLCDLWTDIDVQERFLNSKPTCYLVLGKPGSGSFMLGEAISKKFNCVHLCPKNVILDELDQNSETGKCILFNLKQNRSIKFDTIVSIMKKKIDSPAVQHRGYVLSGLPLVPLDTSPQYLFNSNLYSEEGFQTANEVMVNVLDKLKKKKQKKAKTGSLSSLDSGLGVGAVEEDIEEEQIEENVEVEAEELPVVLPSSIFEPCSNIIMYEKAYLGTTKSMVLNQLHEILNIAIQPDIVIHLTCPEKDLVTKNSHKYINYTMESHTFDKFAIYNELELKWPEKYKMTDFISSYDNHIFNPKYNCRHPINFTQNSTKRVCNYRKHVSPFVEEKLKDYEPKYIIKIDARQTVHQMMYHFSERLIFLPIKPVFAPEPLYLEDPPEELEDFWKLIEELNTIKTANLTFNRYPSQWLNRCPVELKKRQSIIGHPKYAVSFFKHVYMLSSLENMILFCRNPRPYLKLIYLEPTCRIFVMGTQSSGKSLISHCLSWLYDTPVMCYKKFLSEEKQKKKDIFFKTILSEIIATIEDARLLKWQNIEAERVHNLNEWLRNVTDSLQKYVPVFLEILKVKSQRPDKETEDVMSVELDEKLLHKYELIRSRISFLPFLDDINECINVVKNKLYVDFAPLDITTVNIKPGLPSIGDEDVTSAINEYIVTNDLQNEMEPTGEELMNEFCNILTELDNESLKNNECYAKFIIDDFPSDPEIWSLLSEANFAPDNVVTLIENREIDIELIEYYKTIERALKNYAERYGLANDPLIKIKLRHTCLPDTNVMNIRFIVEEYMISALNSVEENQMADDKDVNNESDAITNFTTSIEKFREDWDSVKVKLEEQNKTYVEIELENKSDISVVENVLLGLRKNFFLKCELNEGEDSDLVDEQEESPKDLRIFNDSRTLCETEKYCPIAYYIHGVLWEGKPEFSIKYDNKTYFFSNEESFEIYQKDIVLYQEYNHPYKRLPPLRICVIGCIGSGKTTVSKFIAKELGLIHIDFSIIINHFLLPRHFKKVGRYYENSFTDPSIDEEGGVEFQMGEENENIINDILANESELRRMVFNYFETGVPILSVLMQKLLKKLWFDKPFSETGFVLDGYPRLPSDVDDMVAGFCIPDLVVELESNSEIALQRLSQKMYKTWKYQLTEAKNIAKINLDTERQAWMSFITKHVVAKLIFEELIDRSCSTVDEPKTDTSNRSLIMEPDPQGAVDIDVSLFNFYNDMVQEYPAPIDEKDWEKSEEARERIDARIEGIYETEDEGVQSLKDMLQEQKIKLATINATKPLNKVLRTILYKTSSLRNRNESVFEQTIIIHSDIAEILLSEGFFFLSKFNHMCPVYLLENPCTILAPYKIMKSQGEVYPVIHRSYIYFTYGEKNLIKFRTNPLKYINNNKVHSFIQFPITIGIIGPSKSGKSILTKRLAKRYGLMSISRGMAVRYTLEQLHWTELASQMKLALEEGECISFRHAVQAVQNVILDNRVSTNGFVFDGFPNSASEAMELLNIGLYPMFLLDISNTEQKLIDNSQNEIYYDIIKRKPPFCSPLIQLRYNVWKLKSYHIRTWVEEDIQNLYLLNGMESRWKCLQNATKYIEKNILKIHYYLHNVKNTIVPAGCMCISNQVFQNRMSALKDLCPICLKLNILKNSRHPVDKKGVVQYRNQFYWACADHLQFILKDPKRYLLLDKVEIPELPAIVKTINVTLVYENGMCIVTYAQNLPAQKIVSGSNKYAASFRGNTYLFCSSKCLDVFLAKPHLFWDITIFKDPKIFPKLTLKQLPHIGYLEQTMANIMTDACCAANVVRPKYPGLSIKQSAAIYLALYLKVYNPNISEEALPLFTKTLKVYEARCKLLTDIGLRLRSMDNPFAIYPKCCDRTQYVDSGTVKKPSSTSNLSISI